MPWTYIPTETDREERDAAPADWRTRDPITVIVTARMPALIGVGVFLLLCVGGLCFALGYWAH